MNTLVMAVIAMFGAVLPDASSVPGISGEAVVAGATIDGCGWLRILETEYSVLQVSSSPAVPMTAYDDAGEPMAVSTDGSPLVLSAYSDYWFWVKASSTEDVVFTVEYLEPSLITGGSVSSSLSAAEMAEIWSFSPGSSGKWNFILGGTDELADLDLEIYSGDNTLWAGSYGLLIGETHLQPPHRGRDPGGWFPGTTKAEAATTHLKCPEQGISLFWGKNSPPTSHRGMFTGTFCRN